MHIDRAHRPWAIAVLLCAVLAGWAARTASLAAPNHPGRTAAGLALGAASAGIIVFLSLMGLRRRLLRVLPGTAGGWLRAHVWLASLGLLLALLHGGFRLGSPLSATLMLCLAACVGSGALGSILQRILPTLMAADADAESAGDPVLAVGRLRGQAYQLIWAACGAPPDADGSSEVIAEREAICSSLGALPSAPDRVSLRDFTPGQKKLERFYRRTMIPFLSTEGSGGSPLDRAADAALAFDALTGGVAPELHPALQELAALCEKVRAARRQVRIRAWLHGWLLVHIPLAMATLTLLCAHAVVALRY